jgi:hypothetical protein
MYVMRRPLPKDVSATSSSSNTPPCKTAMIDSIALQFHPIIAKFSICAPMEQLLLVVSQPL